MLKEQLRSPVPPPASPPCTAPGTPALPAPVPPAFPGLPPPEPPSPPRRPKHTQRHNLRPLAQVWGVWGLQGPPAGAGLGPRGLQPARPWASSALLTSSRGRAGAAAAAHFRYSSSFSLLCPLPLHFLPARAPSSPGPGGVGLWGCRAEGLQWLSVQGDTPLSHIGVHGDPNHHSHPEGTETPNPWPRGAEPPWFSARSTLG